MAELDPIDSAHLPAGIRSRYVEGVNGLRVHVLEAGYEEAGRPCVMLVHGFPELAFSWRKLMPRLAAAGYHVIAPDQRGYGRTTGADTRYHGDLASFRMLNLVRDAVGLVAAFGYKQVEAIVGHDYGSSVAAWCALIRPDIFRRVALMSAPFAGPPRIPQGIANGPATPASTANVHDDLANLPRPRKHYQWYYATPTANDELMNAPQGLHAMLRGYYHHKSADWAGNTPHPLTGFTATELAKLPTYYVMDLDEDMAATVSHVMPDAAEIAACKWLPDSELAFYAGEYSRTGFQGGLQWYRHRTTGQFNSELEVFSGRSIDVPACFISGLQDWGNYQSPGAIDAMQSTACSQFRGIHLIEGAGHWVQQEQPETVSTRLLAFLRD